jgi:long-chain acyl-CoA synthetase
VDSARGLDGLFQSRQPDCCVKLNLRRFTLPGDLFELLEQHRAARPDDVALQTISDGAINSVTFAELMRQAQAIGEATREAGVAPGDRVALLLPNDHHFGAAFLGAASAGAVIVPLDPSQDVPRLCGMIAHAECRLLIGASAGRFAEQVRAIRERLPEVAILQSPLATARQPAGAWPLVPHADDSDFLIMYTGGTTGTPKGVRLSLGAILTTIRDTLAVFPLSEHDHILSILPLFHIMAIQANLLGPLYAGAKVSYFESRDPKAIVDAFREHGITAFLCVPLFYYQLHRRIFGEIARQPPAKRMVFRALFRVSGFIRRRLGWNAGRLFFRPVHRRFGPALRGFGVGAARFAPEVAADLHDLGFPFFQGYGMTETSGLATISPMSMRGGLASGRPLASLDLRIEAPDGQGRGEILLRGGNIMRGYWKDEAATRAVLDGGWLRTGDIGHFSNGELHVVGRKKEVIVLSSGKNVFPEPLEAWFEMKCPVIREICIFGLQGAGADAERLHAVVVPDGPKLRELGIVNVAEELRYRIENLNRDLAAHEKLHGFDVRLEPLPRTSSRKLQRFRIQEGFARNGRESAAGFHAGEISAEDSGLLDVLRKMIAHIRPGREVLPWMNLELDLSLDSLERVELLSNVEEKFGLRISAEQAAAIYTVADILSLARNHKASLADWADWGEILREPLSEAEREMAERYLSARPAAAPLFFAGLKVLAFAARFVLNFHVGGPKIWKGDGPLIIAANHQSYLDFPFIAGCLPYPVFRRIFTLSSSRLVKSRSHSWFGVTVRAVPIDPDRHLRTALRIAFEGLRRGMVLCVFPEGHRSIDGILQPFRMGAAILAVESGADTIPCGIAGTGRVWGRAKGGIRLAPVGFGFGAPMRAARGEGYAAFNERLFGAISQLLESQ